MSEPVCICSVEGCTKRKLARGWCAMHYERWRKHGTTDPQRQFAECTVEGCALPTRSAHSPYCEMHYYRLRRTGTTANPPRITGRCLADGCTADATHGGQKFGLKTAGYCRMHYLRLKKRGDVNFEFRGENVHTWTGDEATNRAVYQRIRWQRGKASEYACVDCGGRARHWSYDHTDPNQRYDPEKGPYSTDIDRYHPRCVKCHKRFDMARIMAERVG